MQDRAPTAGPTESVLLLHGLHGSRLSMRSMASGLRRAGFVTHIPLYRSRAVPLETLVGAWLPQHVPSLEDTPRFHIVAYSMGGLLVRWWLREHGVPPHLGRVVMIAPPNGGSEIIDKLRLLRSARIAAGPNGARLGTSRDALPATLGPWPADAPELGIIAGAHELSSRLNPLLARPHDGRVSVAATHLAGEHAHITLHASHSRIVRERETSRQVASFLRTGTFLPPAPTPLSR